MEGELDIYFSNLSELNKVEEEIKEETCCSLLKNQQMGDGVMICKICNNVVTNIISGPEWRYYGAESRGSDQNRCGMPTNPLLPKSSLGSSVSRGYSESANKIGMYQRWNSMPYKERSLYKVFNDIRNLQKACSLLLQRSIL